MSSPAEKAPVLVKQKGRMRLEKGDLQLPEAIAKDFEIAVGPDATLTVLHENGSTTRTGGMKGTAN